MLMELFFILFIIFIFSTTCQCQTTPVIDDDSLLVQRNKIILDWLKATSTPEAAHFMKFKPQYSIVSDASTFQTGNRSVLTLLLNDSHLNTNSELIRRNEREREFYPKCSDDLVQILYNLNSQWALKMLDSNGKLMSGILLGSVTWPGNYKECESVFSPLDKKDHGYFHGRYCMTSWTLNVTKNFSNIPINVGVCVPDSCKGDDIVIAANNVLHLSGQLPLIKNIIPQLSLDSVTCKTGVKPPDTAVIVYLFIVSVFLVLVLSGSSITAYAFIKSNHGKSTALPSQGSLTPLNRAIQRSYGAAEGESITSRKASEQCEVSINYCRSESVENAHVETIKKDLSLQIGPLKGFLLCFCAFTNGNKILTTDVSGRQFLSIHGIRFLSLTWVIMGHSYITAASDISNKLETLKDIDSFSFQMLLQSPFSVDSFFLLSGTLLAVLFLKEADHRSGKINWAYFYVHRIWRLTPVYMFIVGFYILVFKYMGSGPFWDDDHGDSCRGTWWWYLLYINNFIPIREMCVGWSWYLANDMQFYLVSPLYLFTLWRWPKIGITVISFLMAASWIVTGVLTSENDIVPLLSGVTEVQNITDYENRMWDAYDIIYDKPYCRISPYLVGILLGYALHLTKNSQVSLTWWQQIVGWTLAIFCSTSVIFGLYHVHITKAISILYCSFSRTSFVLGLAWVIYACETGHGGVIYTLLSWKVWIPLSRLTYCAYLVHPLLIHGYYQGLQTVLYFTHTTVVTIFLGVLVATYVLAFAVSLTFESPMMNLEKWLLKRSI